jgi:hypothetical protein
MANIHVSQRRTRFFRNTSSLGIKTGFHRKSRDLAMGIMGVVEVEAVVVEVGGEGEGAVGGEAVGMVRRRGNGHGKTSTRRVVVITIEREDTTRRWRGQALVLV